MSPSISTPFRAATSISTPRAKIIPTFSTPSLVNPERVPTSLTLKQLYSESPIVWWAKPSNCVPTWPISLVTTSSLLPRVFLPVFMKVRLVCRLKMRVPKNAMPGPRTWPSSMTSPVLMSRAPRSTVSGFLMWFPEPRSSPAPHFDGQRWLSVGTFHCAKASTGAARRAIAVTVRFMCFPLVENFVQAFVVERAGHPGELVAELALVRGHAVRVEGLARAPDLEHREVIRTVGLLHDLEAHVAGRGAVCLAQDLERDDGVVFLRRDHVDVGHAVDCAGRVLHGADRERIVEAVVGRCVAHGVELVAEFLGARCGHMGVPGALVLPGGGDHELARPDDATHYHGAQVSGRCAARVAIGLQERGGFVPGGRPSLHVGDDIKGAHVGWNGGGCGGGSLGDGVHGEEAQQGRDERGPMEFHVFFSLISPAAGAYRTPGMEDRRVLTVSPACPTCSAQSSSSSRRPSLRPPSVPRPILFAVPYSSRMSSPEPLRSVA